MQRVGGPVRPRRPQRDGGQAQVAPAGVEDERLQPDDAPADDEAEAIPAVAVKPAPWPKDTVEQVRAVADLLAASPVPLSIDDIAARFTARGPWKKRLPRLLDMLVALGRAQEQEGRYGA